MIGRPRLRERLAQVARGLLSLERERSPQEVLVREVIEEAAVLAQGHPSDCGRYETLARHLQDPGWVVVDARFSLEDESWGDAAYREAHIPGAAYAHLGRDLTCATPPKRLLAPQET